MQSDPRGVAVRDSGLTAVRRRLDRWRWRAARGRRIPPELWARARELAHAHGVSRTARALGLDYYALAKRMSVTKRRGGYGSGVDVSRAFVELPMPVGATPVRGPSCRLELSDGGGTRLCVELSGAEPRAIAALARALWGAAR